MELESNDVLLCYKRLVDELLKATSDEKLVKSLMKKIGIKYTTDKVDRLSAVLEFHPHVLEKKGTSHGL